MKNTALSTHLRAVHHDYRTDLRAALLEAKSHSRAGRSTFHRIIVKMPATSPLQWVRALEQSHRFFWSGRGHNDSVAGVGRAAVVEGNRDVDYAAMRRDLVRHLRMAPAGARFFGGVRFDDAGPREQTWDVFPTYRFVMPRFELRAVDGAALCICNVGPDEDFDRVIREVDSLEPAGPGPTPQMPDLMERVDTPGRAEWNSSVEWALSAFSRTALAKVVLARKARLTFAEDIDPFSLLSAIASNTPNCYHFIFFEAGSSFLGASPEMLFSQAGSSIRSEAVAGTAPRGETEGADRRLGRRLLQSEKDQREHEYVRQSIKEVLTDLTRVLHVDTKASDMKLAQGRHLRSEVSGILAEGFDAVDLLEALHPTPAVGGHPQDEAMDVIRHLEPFDRGWYAGPVGWVGETGAEFAVGIRSGLCRRNVLDLYSGAGIVCGSEADLEWREVEQKIGDFLRALRLDDRR